MHQDGRDLQNSNQKVKKRGTQRRKEVTTLKKKEVSVFSESQNIQNDLQITINFFYREELYNV